MSIRSIFLAFTVSALFSVSSFAEEVCIYEIESCFEDIVEACAIYPSAAACQTPDVEPEPPVEVSEPGIIGLLSLGLLGLIVTRRNQK